MAELVDALDLGSSAARCESSSLSFRTKLEAELTTVKTAVKSPDVCAPQAPGSDWLKGKYYAGNN